MSHIVGSTVLTVTAHDDVEVLSTSLTVDGNPVTLDSHGQATASITTGGLHTAVATATDFGENEATAMCSAPQFDRLTHV